MISGTNFGATQGAGGVTIGGATQTVTAWGDTSITVTVARGVNKYGVAVNVIVTRGDSAQSSPFALTSIQPQTDWAFVNIVTPNTTTANRITAAPDIASGDQIAYETASGAVALFDDATFSITGALTEFDVEVWTPVDGWGSVATQSLGLAASITESVAPSDSHTTLKTTPGSVNETVTATESSTSARSTGASVVEPVTVSETLSSVKIAVAIIDELATTNTIHTASATIVALIAESVSSADDYSGLVTNPNLGAILEVASVVDMISATQSMGTEIFEPVSSSEVQSATSVSSATSVEPVISGDTSTVSKITPTSTSESVGAADLYAAIQSTSAAILELTNADDILSAIQFTLASIVETVVATSLVDTGNFIMTSVTEQTVADDFVAWVRSFVAGDPRVLIIEAEDRTVTIQVENRTIVIEPENRTISVSVEDRSIPI